MDRSARLMERAVRSMPGGVNSPVRAFRSVGGDPLFMERGEGSRIFDVDGNSYIDYVMSYGPLVLGHADERQWSRSVDASRSRWEPLSGRRRSWRSNSPSWCARPFHRSTVVQDDQLRHRGDHERHPGGARLHRAGEDPQVRRQLPRARGRPARRRRLRASRRWACPTVPVSRKGLRRTPQYCPTTTWRRCGISSRASRARQFAAVILEPVSGNMGCVSAQ